GIVLTDDGCKIVDGADQSGVGAGISGFVARIAMRQGRDVSGYLIVSAGRGHSFPIPLGVSWVADENGNPGSSLTGPQVTQNPFRQLAHEIENEPNRPSGCDYRQNEVGEQPPCNAASPHQDARARDCQEQP